MHRDLFPLSRTAPHVHSRTVQVDLGKDLTFHMAEALFQHRPSHWARVWPSSLALSRWLLDQLPADLPHCAMELGCGVGLVSMTLAHLGVQTQATDRVPRALSFALANAADNDVAGLTASHLDWSEPVGAPVEFLAASDLLYEEGAPAMLFALVQTFGLLAPHGALLVGGPCARATPLNELVGLLRDVGYSHAHEIRSVEWESRTEDIDVHLLRRPRALA